MAELDIVIPVFNEGSNILRTLASLRDHVRTSFRVLICYDFDEDNTLSALAARPADGIDIALVKNAGRGPHAAVRSGFAATRAPFVLVYMADDDYNAQLIDTMVARARAGTDVVAASRFIPGGSMKNCSSLTKSALTHFGAFVLTQVAGLPVHDGTNAFKLFSRRLLDTVEIESRTGFTFAIELTVKAARLDWKLAELPAQWFERSDKPSRFRVLKWLPAYIRWLLYAMGTRWLRRGPETVRRREKRNETGAIGA